MALIRLLVLACLALPATAQERLTPDQFLDLAEGKTLTFQTYPGGMLVGVEQFLSREQSRWARADGSCVIGEIFIDGPALCFAYPDDPRDHCWWPLKVDDRLFVRFADLDAPSTQEIIKITERPVICEEVPSV